MNQFVTAFYNDLAAFYRYLFHDWHEAVARHGNLLDEIFQAQGFAKDKNTLYDCTCGIGTQTFGLALKGWKVHATDLSPNAIALAKTYSTEFDIEHTPTFDVLDLLHPPTGDPIQYDIVMSLDNAIPHFMSDQDLRTGLETMRVHLASNGLVMIGIRDYDALRENPPGGTQPNVTDTDEGRIIVYQIWDWADDLSSYKLNLYVTRHTENTITTQHFQSEYRALQRETLTQAMEQVGFSDIQWLLPEETGGLSPIVIARKL